jgi:hypothetical protein
MRQSGTCSTPINLTETVFWLIDTASASGVPTHISAVSLLEVVYLVERGRIAAYAFW